MSDEIWVLGGTGRTGRAIATLLAARGAPVALVGRDAARVHTAAQPLGARSVVAGSPDAMAEAIGREHPAVVVNTVGPFQRTAAIIADATIPTGHYVDLGNDIATVLQLRGRDSTARQAGHTIVTGAGFGVTATESVTAWLADGRPPARRVRTDMIPSIASEAGAVGEALAASLLDGLPGIPGGSRFSGRRIVDGQLGRARIGGMPTRLTTPDGDVVTTAMMPLGELLAAQTASGAGFAESASSEVPSGAIARLAIPVAFSLLHIAPLRRFLIRRVAAMTAPARPMPRQHSWAHAHLEWDDGQTREGWLRVGEASEFTTATEAEVAHRLLHDQGRPGTFTPAQLFGPTLAEACAGEYSIA